MAVPMSGWRSTRPPRTPATTTTGRRVNLDSCMRSERRASRSATNTRRANLAGSDGWKLRNPYPSQRVEPLTLMPTNCTATSSTRETTTIGQARAAHRR